MACTQVNVSSFQLCYYYKTSDQKRNLNSRINTWTKWKKSFKCKNGVCRQHRTIVPKCCLFQWIFSPAGRLCSRGKRFEWANVIFAAYFILRGHDIDIDFLRILFRRERSDDENYVCGSQASVRKTVFGFCRLTVFIRLTGLDAY